VAQASWACWVVQEDAMDGSLQAKSAMSATEPPRTPGIDQTIIRTTSCFIKQRCPICTGYIPSCTICSFDWANLAAYFCSAFVVFQCFEYYSIYYLVNSKTSSSGRYRLTSSISVSYIATC